MQELCAFWEKDRKGGGTYLSGKLGKVRLVVFKNKYKTKDNHPDYICYVGDPEPAPDQTEEAF